MVGLLWKDARLLIPVLVFTLLLGLLPYLIFYLHFSDTNGAPELSAFRLSSTAFYSLFLSTLSAAVLGGSVIAGENADGSVQFLSYLPLSTKKILASKLMVSFTILGLPWASNLFVVAYVASRWPAFVNPVGYCALVCVSFGVFGSAWFFSSFMTTTGLPAMLAVLVQLILVYALDRMLDPFRFDIWTAVAVLEGFLGLFAVIAGGVVYYRGRIV